MTRPAAALGLALLAVAAGALALRLPRLDVRPMHGDEGNQAVKTGLLLETGQYAYDPSDHHGPTLYFLTIPWLWAHGVARAVDLTDGLLRQVPVLFGAGLVLLLWPLGAGLGRPAACAAAVLTAVSTAMVFYSRYFIQETLLVFFTLAFLLAAWRHVRTGAVGWAVLAGAMLGLMHATKETWVLAAGSMAAAAVLAALWTRLRGGEAGAAPVRLRPAALAAGAGAAVLVAGVLYSSFFTHWRGPLDSLLAYRAYLHRAGGAGLHDQPWYTYLHILIYYKAARGFVWSEGLVVGLATVGAVAALRRRTPPGADAGLLRFLAFYAPVLALVYALIPYKTPWCLLGFLHGMILLAGVGAAALVRWVRVWPAKAAVGLVLAALAAHLGWQAYRASYRLPADLRNPYVYAHTSTDLRNLVERVEDIADVCPDGRDMLVKVITPENYWPLPWYLRRFPHVGWWHEVPEGPDAPVIITSADVQEALDARLRDRYNRLSTFGLRPAVLLNVYVREDLWEAFLARRAGPQAGGQGGGRP